MGRCGYTHPIFSEYDAHSGWHCDGTNQCWQMETGQFEVDGVVQERCLLHAPEGQEPTDRPDWRRENRGADQSALLTTLVADWNAANQGQNDPLALVLPGIRCGDVSFRGHTFTGNAYFGKATFTGDAYFNEATFTGHAYFGEATFTGHAYFGEATFTGYAYFRKATFTGYASFGKATFRATLTSTRPPSRASSTSARPPSRVTLDSARPPSRATLDSTRPPSRASYFSSKPHLKAMPGFPVPPS